jgi:N6-L-threonylcarbamoyladenine synthase
MHFLAIETSCDETAAAVFTDEPRVLANVIASQTDLHARFGGVVPEIAARAHQRQLLPVIDEALSRAGITIRDIGAVAVHNSPGLVGALLVGVSAAKALAVALNVPLIAVNHVHAHVYACRLAAGRDIFPCVGFVVSGGHTVLFHCRSPLEFELLGTTRDDAAGEAFDKVASILGLPFPGGPAIEREGQSGDSTAYRFPRSMLEPGSLDFSFSGLKTAVLYAVRGQNRTQPADPPTGQTRADMAASFQAAVVEVLIRKAQLALRQSGLIVLAVGGGVSANKSLRQALNEMCRAEGVELIVPPMEFCTDNAAMAALAVEKWKRGEFAPLDLDAEPNLR